MMNRAIAGHNEKVLLYVLDSNTESNLSRYLRAAGYKVYSSKKATLAAYEEKQPDLMIIDLEFLHSDVLKFIADLVENSQGRPVIVLSHEGIEEQTVEALKLNVTDYILKPVREEVLLFSVHSSLERARLARENISYRDELEASNLELQMRLEELQQDRQAGRLVQSKMLPPTPWNMLGYHFEHIVLPASDLAGDFVDYHQVSDDQLVFFLIDVTGHGASSAFVTVLIKHLAIRSRKHFEKADPYEVNPASWMLEWINRNLLEMEIDRYLTVFLGVINTEKNQLNYSYGGHFPRAILSSQEGTRFLDGKGLPVGLFADAKYEDYFIDLPDEFCITMVSDGVLEILDQSSLQEKEDYLLALARKEDNSVSSLYERLKLEDAEYPPDDITIFTVSKLANEYR